VEVRALVARLTADAADHLSPNHVLARADSRIIQVGVERVVAAAVVDQHRSQVQAQRSRRLTVPAATERTGVPTAALMPIP